MIILAMTLRQAAKLYVTTLKETFMIAFVIALLNQLLDWQLVNTAAVPNDWQTSFLFAILGMIMLIVRLFGDGLIYCRQYFRLYDQPQSLSVALYYLMRRFYKLFLAGILVVLMLFGVMIFLSSLLVAIKLNAVLLKPVMAGAWMLVVTLFYFYAPLILFSKKTVGQALRLSVIAAYHHFFRTLMLMLFGALLELLPIYLIIFVGGHVMNETSSFGLEQTTMVILLSFILPFTTAITLIWYHRLFQRYHNPP